MSGILGQADLSASTNTTLYTVPAGKLSAVNVNICNRGTSVANVRIALAANATPANAEYIEYNFPVAANGGTLERTGIMIQASKLVVVYSDQANVSANVWGVEE